MHFNQPGELKDNVEIRPLKTPGYTPFCVTGGKSLIIKTSAQDTLTRLLKPASMMVTTQFETTKRNDARHCMLAGLAILQGAVSPEDVHDATMKMVQKQRFT